MTAYHWWDRILPQKVADDYEPQGFPWLGLVLVSMAALILVGYYMGVLG